MWKYAPFPQYMFHKIHNRFLVCDVIVANVIVPWKRYPCLPCIWGKVITLIEVERIGHRLVFILKYMNGVQILNHGDQNSKYLL